MPLFTVTLPDIGEGVVEGEVIEWLKEVGAAVKQDEPVVVVMTDKATVELPAPYPGIISKHYYKPGEIAHLDKPLYDIQTDVEPVKKEQAKQAAKPCEEPSYVAKRADGIKALPKVRHLARDMDIDLKKVTPSGKEGRIEIRDLRSPLDFETPATHLEGDEEIPMIGIRGAMAKKMEASNRGIPHFSYFEQAEVGRLVQLRQNVSKATAEVDIHLTYMPFFIRALSLTIHKFPEINASLENTKLIVHKAHHIGIAIASERGLIVPVLKDVDKMNLETIIRSYDALIKRAKAGKLKPEEMRDATITLSNYGVLGGAGRWATPIINPPEVAILGLARIQKGPVVKGDQVVVRDVMNLSWSFDHRVLDGSAGAKISNFYVQLIQNPASLL